MNTKQIAARRAVAVGGACLTGLMLAACQSGIVTTTAVSSPTDGSTAGTSVTAAGGQGSGASTPTAAAGGSSTGSAGNGNSGTNSGSGNGSTTSPPNQPAPPAQGGGVTACTNSQIHTSLGQRNSGDANFDVTLVFTNTGSQTCTLLGYAGATIEYTSQSPLNATRRMTAYLGGDAVDSTPQPVTLHPGGSASDLLNWNPGTSNTECLDGPGTAKLLITAPGTTNTLTAATGIGGLCDNFSITPVVPGSNGEKTS